MDENLTSPPDQGEVIVNYLLVYGSTSGVAAWTGLHTESLLAILAGTMRPFWEYQKDVVKAFVRRNLLRFVDYQPRIETLFTILEAEGFPCRDLRALEVFGKHGLWHTADYLHRCRMLDLWEINPPFARLATRLGNKVRVFCGDSVQAIRSGDTRIGTYDLIVIDNPASPFGSYCEHFDLFPFVLDYLTRDNAGLLVVNFWPDKRADLCPTDVELHARRRAGFYGVISLTPSEALSTYTRHANGTGRELVHSVLVPRSSGPGTSYLAMAFKAVRKPVVAVVKPRGSAPAQ